MKAKSLKQFLSSALLCPNTGKALIALLAAQVALPLGLKTFTNTFGQSTNSRLAFG
jgi:hypothetical protein